MSAGQRAETPPAQPDPRSAYLLTGEAHTASGLLRFVLRSRRRVITASALFAMLHQAAEAAVPIVVGMVIDAAVATGDTGALLWGLGGLILVFAALTVAWVAAVRTDYLSVLAATHHTRMAVAGRILHPAGSAEDRPPGALLSIATADSRRAAGVTQAVVIAAAALAALVVTAVVLLGISVLLGVVVIGGALVVSLLVRVLARPLEQRSATEQAAAARAMAVAGDLVSGLRTVKGLGAEQPAADRYRRASRDWLAGTLRAVRAQAGYDGVVVALTGVLLAVVALLASTMAVNREISIGELVTAFGLTQFMSSPFGRLGHVGALVAMARASAGRVATLLATPAAIVAGTATLPAPVRGGLRVRDLRHGGLRGVDLRAEPGELLGVVAADPSDAAALVACLGREAEPADGVIEVDGTAIGTLDPEQARAAVLAAAQHGHLFHASLAENVLAGNGAQQDNTQPEATQPEATQHLGPHATDALRAAAADEVADTLPDGSATVLTEAGRSLSGGQQQRVALARALAADPPVLVLHDPTTAVDAATEHRIGAGLRAARSGRTTVLVTTSPGLLAATDRVVLIQDGAVLAEGTHAELASGWEHYRAAVLT